MSPKPKVLDDDVERERPIRLVLNGVMFGKARHLDRSAEQIMLSAQLGPSWSGKVSEAGKKSRPVARVEK